MAYGRHRRPGCGEGYPCGRQSSSSQFAFKFSRARPCISGREENVREPRLLDLVNRQKRRFASLLLATFLGRVSGNGWMLGEQLALGYHSCSPNNLGDQVMPNARQSAQRTIVSRHILEPTGKGNPRRWWAPWRRHGKRSAAWLRSARAQAPAFRPVPCERRPHGRRGPIQRSSNPYSAHRVARFYPRSRRGMGK
jgi:hypothetical protein